MTTSTTTKTSYTRLNSWLRCPKQHKYRYIDGAVAERVSAVMLLGVAFHEAAELLFRGIKFGEPPVSEEVYAAFDRAFDDSVEFNNRAGCPVDFGKSSHDELIGKGHEMLRVFLDDVDRSLEVLDIERPFQFEIEPGRMIEGVLDLVVKQPGGVLVVDLKTSGTSFSQDRLDFDAQATIYTVAGKRLYGGQVDFEFWQVTRTKTPRLVRHPVVRDARDEAELIELVREVEAASVFGVFPRRRDRACNGCEFRDRCDTERGAPCDIKR